MGCSIGSVHADLRTNLAPFAGTETPETEAPTIADGEQELTLFSPRLLAEFYESRDYSPAWDQRRAQTLLKLARDSRNDGFIPADFHAEAIARVIDAGDLGSADPSRRDAADLLLSDALLRYVHHFRFGKQNPRHVNPGWTFVEPADAEQLKADMARALAAADLSSELAQMLPNPDFYRNLKKGYQRYLALADRGGWQEIPGGGNLRAGVSDPRIPMIREHLQVLEGFEPGFVADPEVYDEALAEAVKGFQRRSGLAADGVVGPNTLHALNRPIDKRLVTIRANLERMRWLYNDLPADYLFVDLTAYELFLVRDHEEVWRTKGIIGTLDNQTPMFRDEMEHVVFNPTWTVPRSIEKKFRGVPAGYKRVRSGGQYYLVQQPGPRNALGRVKFMFPNGHAIYLHDTPSRHLFSRAQRAYSHGCIRVYQPLTLAQQVLNKPAWSEGEINRVVRRGRTRWVNLEEHLPVLLYYLTALADDQGRVGFRRDVYNRDPRLIAALDEPVDGAKRIAFAEPEPEPAPDSELADAQVEVAAADAASAEAETPDAASTDGESVPAADDEPTDADALAAAEPGASPDAAPETDAEDSSSADEPLAEATAESADQAAGGSALEAEVSDAASTTPAASGAALATNDATADAADPRTINPASGESPAALGAEEAAADQTRTEDIDTADTVLARPPQRPAGTTTIPATGPVAESGNLGAALPLVLSLDTAGQFAGSATGIPAVNAPAFEGVSLDLASPALGSSVSAPSAGTISVGNNPSGLPLRIAEEPPVLVLPRD